MTATSAVSVPPSSRPEVARVLRATESRRAFHDRVLDGVRKFLEDHAMAGKTGAREFSEFEKTLHERLLEAEREIVADVRLASVPTIGLLHAVTKSVSMAAWPTRAEWAIARG